MFKWAVSYTRRVNGDVPNPGDVTNPWEMTGLFETQDQAISVSKQLFRDLLNFSEWVEIRITKVRV